MGFREFQQPLCERILFNKSIKQSKIKILDKIENKSNINEIIRSVSFHKYI
jgi:hypothetical protein